MIAVGSNNGNVLLICDADSAKTLAPLISLELNLSDALVLQSLLAQTIRVLSKGASTPPDLSEEVVMDNIPAYSNPSDEAAAADARTLGEREAAAEQARDKMEALREQRRLAQQNRGRDE